MSYENINIIKCDDWIKLSKSETGLDDIVYYSLCYYAVSARDKYTIPEKEWRAALYLLKGKQQLEDKSDSRDRAIFVPLNKYDTEAIENGTDIAYIKKMYELGSCNMAKEIKNELTKIQKNPSMKKLIVQELLVEL